MFASQGYYLSSRGLPTIPEFHTSLRSSGQTGARADAEGSLAPRKAAPLGSFPPLFWGEVVSAPKLGVHPCAVFLCPLVVGCLVLKEIISADAEGVDGLLGAGKKFLDWKRESDQHALPREDCSP